MHDESILDALRAAQGRLTPVELAELLEKLAGHGLSQGDLVTYFKRAFPEIPLRALLEAGAWSRASDGHMSDEQFNDLLAPWLMRRAP